VNRHTLSRVPYSGVASRCDRIHTHTQPRFHTRCHIQTQSVTQSGVASRCHRTHIHTHPRFHTRCHIHTQRVTHSGVVSGHIHTHTSEMPHTLPHTHNVCHAQWCGIAVWPYTQTHSRNATHFVAHGGVASGHIHRIPAIETNIPDHQSEPLIRSHCNAQHVAGCESAPHTHCNTLQHAATHCNVLHTSRRDNHV